MEQEIRIWYFFICSDLETIGIAKQDSRFLRSDIVEF